ncbi:hypothetical protein [Ulvibacter litoralis]|uniref:Uncharacterized protein n=1 Tax=Ulvibacter litoralis TaxID=227084 RepID=A0A1G7FL70_9FLAO|nr:hypothetical protein [Ulvibacter litoralis]GHC50691.1 hypothetical protein GCM10008083_12830 [Ulvibacter litoralis]SDE76623.1 hypothetical protein SAMN05421855_102626 [Ulvibacter litoralis]
MVKLFSISFSFLILLQSIGLSFADIARIDELVEHAQYHNEQFGDNIAVFLAKHYGELKAEHHKEHHEEKEDHEQLPFQHQTNVSSMASFVLNCAKNEFKTPDFSESRTHNFFYQEPSSSLHLKGLFQPPRQS